MHSNIIDSVTTKSFSAEEEYALLTEEDILEKMQMEVRSLSYLDQRIVEIFESKGTSMTTQTKASNS